LPGPRPPSRRAADPGRRTDPLSTALIWKDQHPGLVAPGGCAQDLKKCILFKISLYNRAYIMYKCAALNDCARNPARRRPEAFISLESEVARCAMRACGSSESSDFRPSKSGSLTSSCLAPRANNFPRSMQLLQTEISLSQGKSSRRPNGQPRKRPRPAQSQNPRPQHPGREPLPAHLERREVVLPCLRRIANAKCVGPASDHRL